MTNAQNIEAIVATLEEEKRKLTTVYKEAERQNHEAYERVLVWEEAYTASGEDEAVGNTLDEVYEEYEEANSAMWKADERLEAVEEALEGLCRAIKLAKRLGL